MKREYFGDSYDMVKRFWAQLLSPVAPLYAEPRFIPTDLQAAFTRLTGIGMLPQAPPHRYCLLNDPDTGVHAPGARDRPQRRSHIALACIASQCRRPGVECVVTFDQSASRTPGRPRAQQREEKLRHLASLGIPAFYYVSHAPFLFAFGSQAAASRIAEIVRDAGLPDSLMQHVPCQSSRDEARRS
jgi:hypothetical protein